MCTASTFFFVVLGKVEAGVNIYKNCLCSVVGTGRIWYERYMMANFFARQGQDTDMISMFKSLVETRIVVYVFNQQMWLGSERAVQWCVKKGIVMIINEFGRLVFNW